MRLPIAAFAAAFLSATAVEAQTTATFSYVDTANNIDLTGQLTGTLSGKYFTILDTSNLTFDGKPIPYTPVYDGSLDAYYGYGEGHNGDGTAVVTLDGSYMDWLMDNGHYEGFYFGDGDNFGGPVYAGGDWFGNSFLTYDSAGWTLDISVPEPASLALLGFGLGAVAFARRRKVGQGAKARVAAS